MKKLASKFHGLDIYVVTGIDPYSGKPASQSEDTDDIYIHHTENGFADTYISCDKTYVTGGVEICKMHYGLEPDLEALITVYFTKYHLKNWHYIKSKVSKFMIELKQ